MARGKSDTCLGERFFLVAVTVLHTPRTAVLQLNQPPFCVWCVASAVAMCARARRLRSPHRCVYGVLSLYTSNISQQFNMSESLTTQVIPQPSNTSTYGA
jgi:hypothetical protein